MTTTTPETAASAFGARTVRPFYWSVRRELWEHRSLYIAPLVAAGVVLFGFLISAANLPHWRHVVLEMPEHKRAMIASIPYHMAAVAIMGTGVIVGVLYCLGGLYNERRDRTILFWKSLPVSDLVTVLSKAVIPLLVLPVIVFAVILVLLSLMLAVYALSGLPGGLGGMTPLEFLGRMTVVLAYGSVVTALWYAPIWGWLLMVSAWSRRTPFLWAFLPPLAIMVLEAIAFQSGHFAHFLAYRLGAFEQAFNEGPAGAGMTVFVQPDPLRFLSNLDLWSGLVVAAAFLAAAVWLRRRRESI